MISKKEAAAELLRRRAARKELGAYIAYTTPGYVGSWFSRSVCEALDKFIDDMQKGIRPILILQAPPQHGKSEIVSRKLPPFLLGRFPNWRIAAASYSSTLADAMSLDVRRNLVAPEHLCLFPSPDVKRKYAVDRNGEFSSPGGTGGYIGDGIGGGFTGRPADCLVAGTKILTSAGSICIDELFKQRKPCKIVTFNHVSGVQYNEIEAFKRSKGVGIYRITSVNGRVFEATGDHRIYTELGYVKASELSPGDVLLSCVQDDHNEIGCGYEKSVMSRRKRNLLQSSLFRADEATSNESVDEVYAVRRKHWGLQVKILLDRLRKIVSNENASGFTKCLRNVFQRIPCGSRERKIPEILLQKMCGSSTRATHDGREQSTLSRRSKPASLTASFSKGLSTNATSCHFKGWWLLRSLWNRKGADRSASHRRMVIKQRIEQPNNPMRDVSQRYSQSYGFSLESDYVRMVERVRETDTVYDIQVAGDHNFFANGILVHNCFIIDDPIKNAQEALSPTTKASHWNWYQSTCKTRMSANSGQIIMATSWAEDDLPASIAALHKGDPRLTILRFPAINEPSESGYNPQLPLGPLVPELHPLEQLLELKAELSDYWWSAIYQQSPKSIGGNVFKESGLRYYLPKDLPAKFDKVVASLDATFKDTDGTDYVVGQVWGKLGANSYLLAQSRARMSFTKTVAEVIKIKRDHPNIRQFYIEDKANGPAVIDTLKGVVSGLIPVEPDGSKLARAHAVTSYWEAGNVWLPHPDLFPWVKDLVAELTAFPAAANDDQVDAMTQALRQLYPLFNKLKISQAAINKAMGRS